MDRLALGGLFLLIDNMKKIAFLLFALLLFTNCAHRITRAGYEASYLNQQQSCNAVIKRGITIPDSLATKIGSVGLRDTGFSVVCNEEDALQILQEEACALNADLIVITNEKRPDFMSSCYRCSAEFYQLQPGITKEEFHNDDAFNPENVRKRVAKDRVNNFFYGIGAVLVGIAIGSLVFMM